MNQEDANIPHFFLVSDNYCIGTSKGIADSNQSVDLSFRELVENYELQVELRMASAMWANPRGRKKRNSYEMTAGYLAAFASDSSEVERRREYLDNNGLVRILVHNDDALLEKVKKLVA